MKVWITRYALTKGIVETEGEILQDKSLKVTSGEYRGAWFWHKDFELTEEDAKVRAEEMRMKKIDSLKKRILKLEKKKF